MNKKKMRNPLQKRVPKELIGEWRKYLVIFLLLAITIGFVSGMYVANSSMLKAIDDSVTKYNLEYGHFELNGKADEELLAKLESGEKADVWAYATEKARAGPEEGTAFSGTRGRGRHFIQSGSKQGGCANVI